MCLDTFTCVFVSLGLISPEFSSGGDPPSRTWVCRPSPRSEPPRWPALWSWSSGNSSPSSALDREWRASPDTATHSTKRDKITYSSKRCWSRGDPSAGRRGRTADLCCGLINAGWESLLVAPEHNHTKSEALLHRVPILTFFSQTFTSEFWQTLDGSFFCFSPPSVSLSLSPHTHARARSVYRCGDLYLLLLKLIYGSTL